MNNVSCKRVYEKAWRSHLHTGLMLKAGVKQFNQRRKAPQISFKENCTFFFRYIPKQLHTFSLICCAYSIKCSAFYNVCLCWNLSARGLGVMQCGKGCCAGKHRVTASTTLSHSPFPCEQSIGAGPGSGTCVTGAEGHRTSPGECCVWATPCKDSAQPGE